MTTKQNKIGWDEELMFLAEEAGLDPTDDILEDLSFAAHEAVRQKIEEILDEEEKNGIVSENAHNISMGIIKSMLKNGIKQNGE